MHSSLGRGAVFNAMAMHCGYDGFASETLGQDAEVITSRISLDKSQVKTSSRTITLLIDTIEDITSEVDTTNIALYICLDDSYYLYDKNDEFIEFFGDLKKKNILYYFDVQRVKRFTYGRNSFIYAFKNASELFKNDAYEQVLIISVGSNIMPKDISFYHAQNRLLTDNNSNGFIPGEAATAILLSKPTGEENEIIISGVGTAKETATIYNEEELLRGKGLSEAIMEASNQAKVPIHETSFRVGSMSGEEYFFDEATLAQTKTLKQKIPDHPLWHPADSIGEVGAAIGGAMVIQTYYAMLKGYAPGDNAICHISNDDELRGAFIMQHTHKKTIEKEATTDSLEGLYFSDIIKQQLKHDAPYAWFLKETASHSPLFRKKDIQRLDDRLESYMECFILSQRANDSLLEMLNLDDWGAVYVMARVALVAEDDDVFFKAVEAVNNKQQAKELSGALKCKEYDTLKEKLQTLITHTNPWVRVACVEALNYFKVHIESSAIQRLLEDESSQVQEAVLKLIGDHKRMAYTQEIKVFVDHENEAVKYAATYAGCMLQVPKAYQTLQTFCFSQNTYLREALTLLYSVVKDEKIASLLEDVSKQTLSPRIKAYNLAMAGYPEAIPILINQMQKLDHALYCGEAFSFITGVDLEDADLIRVANLSEEEEETLMQSRKADEWTQSYEEDLPLPDVALVKAWWQTHQQSFVQGTRYLAGKTYTQENLENIKETGTQAQRKVAGLVLKLKYTKEVVLRDETFSVDSLKV